MTKEIIPLSASPGQTLSVSLSLSQSLSSFFNAPSILPPFACVSTVNLQDATCKQQIGCGRSSIWQSTVYYGVTYGIKRPKTFLAVNP